MTWQQRLWRRKKMEEELEKELRFHLDQHTADLITQGLDPVEALRRARLALGGPEQVKEKCRDVRGTRWLEDLLQDLRYGVRISIKRPGFTLIAVFTLALGIGANTSIFSVINALLLRSLPFAEADQLVMIWETQPDVRGPVGTYPDFLDWRAEAQSFQGMAAFSNKRYGKAELTGQGETIEAQGFLVSQNLFPLLGLKPVLGRNFLPEEEQSINNRVVILSQSLWRRGFADDPGIIGKSIQLDGASFTVVGVMGEQYPLETDFWLPLSHLGQDDLTKRTHHSVQAIGRLKPGATIEQGRREMETIAERLRQLYPATNKNTGVELTPMRHHLAGNLRPIVLLVFAAVALLLLIACANVSNLMLAQSAGRQRELAIRAAIGAGRGRLVRQLLVESLLLAALGGVAGLALASLGIPLLRSGLLGIVTGKIPGIETIGIDWRTLAFTFSVSLLTAVLFGALPALQISCFDLNRTLKEGGKGSAGAGRRNLSRTLVMAEVALAVLVLVGAGLLVRSMNKLLQVDPGFRADHLLSLKIELPRSRYHDGTFYIFSNVNRHRTQLFRARNPAGPWTRTEMKRSFHDLSVLFDTDGRIYVVWGYQGINFAQLNDEITDIVPGTERMIIPKESGMGEGLHFYKINGKYLITSAWFAGRMRMPCARADKPEGPYEVNQAISADEDFGLAEGYRLQRGPAPPFNAIPPNSVDRGRMSLHQGGIVNTPSGEWWGFSMMDYNSVGRLTCLSPVTWQDGWPYFGLPGNLKRTPRTWVKPNTGYTSPPLAPYERRDDFSGPKLKAVWQWNHLPDDTKWSLTERPGFLRMHSLPATDLWWARNTLTQRAIGPVSISAAELDTSGMKAGDVAGLALFNFPYAWIGVRRETDGQTSEMLVEQFDQTTGKTARVPLKGTRVWLRAYCDFLTEKAMFSYSTDGKKFEPLGEEFTMIFQLKTFQGIRYSLFHYHTGDGEGGYADFDKLTVDEPHPRGLMKPIPFGKKITISVFGDGSALVVKDGLLSAVPASDQLANGSAARFKVVDQGLGRVALQWDDKFISVAAKGQVILRSGRPTDSETFQWTETPYGDLILLSLVTHRHLRVEPGSGVVTADHPGPQPDRKDGSCFTWKQR